MCVTPAGNIFVHCRILIFAICQVRCYIKPILATLLPKVTSSNASLATAVLCTLGELFKTVGRDVVPYQDKLLPLIINTLHDQSSVSKRTVALNTLGQLAGQTGNVVKPYTLYPKLLHLLLNMLHGGAGGDGSNVPWTLRREVIKTFGILGAIDPHKHMLALQRTKHRQGTGKDIRAGTATVDGEYVAKTSTDANAALEVDHKRKLFHEDDQFGEPQQRGAAVTEAQPRQNETSLPSVTPASEEYYSTVAISRLMQVMRETTLGAHHHMAVQAQKQGTQPYLLKNL